MNLMKILIRDANENDMGKVFDLVQDLAIFEKKPDAIDFYKKKGAKLKEDWKIFHLSGKNLLAKSKQ